VGDTLNITCNFLYCNHQVHSDFDHPVFGIDLKLFFLQEKHWLWMADGLVLGLCL
jgi:hypothetical protein